MHGHQAANTEVAAPRLGGRCRNGLTDDLQPRCWERGSVGPLPLTQLVFRPQELAVSLETPSSRVCVAPEGSAAGLHLCLGARTTVPGARTSLQGPRT